MSSRTEKWKVMIAFPCLWNTENRDEYNFRQTSLHETFIDKLTPHRKGTWIVCVSHEACDDDKSFSYMLVDTLTYIMYVLTVDTKCGVNRTY